MSKVNQICFGSTTLCDWLRNLHTFFRIAFPLLPRQLQVFASSVDWFTGLPVSIVIGHNEPLMCDNY